MSKKENTTGTTKKAKCAWLVWEANYPDEGVAVIFTKSARRSVALAHACIRQGYGVFALADFDSAPSDVVTVMRAESLDAYAESGDVPDEALSAAVTGMLCRIAREDIAAGCL